MKNLAILVYPEFSMQEIGDLMFMFRWHHNVKTTIVSTSLSPVVSEEGVYVNPQVTTDDFKKEDYYALVLSGCSDFGEAFQDDKLNQFLRSFVDDHSFIIAAICSGPVFLSRAGLLDTKKFTNSMYVEANERFPFIKSENILYQALVRDQNIITAVGDAYRIFAIEVSRACGFECRDDAMSERFLEWTEDDFKHHLSEEELIEFDQFYKQYY